MNKNQNKKFNIIKCSQYEQLSKQAADFFFIKAKTKLQSSADTIFLVFFSGGDTPSRTYSYIAKNQMKLTRDEWNRVLFFIGDDWLDGRNFRKLENYLLKELKINKNNIFPIIPEKKSSTQCLKIIKRLAADYEKQILNSMERNHSEIDLIFIGIGGDDYGFNQMSHNICNENFGQGKMLSLFPNHDVMKIEDLGVKAVQVLSQDCITCIGIEENNRITITKSTVLKANSIMVLLSGESKHHIFKKLINPKSINELIFPPHVLYRYSRPRNISIFADKKAYNSSNILYKINYAIKRILRHIIKLFEENNKKIDYNRNERDLESDSEPEFICTKIILYPSSSDYISRTLGHYHEKESFEIHHILSGKAQFHIQKPFCHKSFVEYNKISHVYTIEANQNDWILIPPGYGLTIFNLLNEETTIVNYRQRKNKKIYDSYRKLNGPAHLIITDNHEFRINSHYEIIPDFSSDKIPDITTLPQVEIKKLLFLTKKLKNNAMLKNIIKLMLTFTLLIIESDNKNRLDRSLQAIYFMDYKGKVVSNPINISIRDLERNDRNKMDVLIKYITETINLYFLEGLFDISININTAFPPVLFKESMMFISELNKIKHIKWKKIYDKNFYKAIKHLIQNFNKKKNLDIIAGESQVTKYYLQRNLKKIICNTYIEAKKGLRLEKAKKLLIETDQYITEISMNLGFYDTADFNHNFRAYTGFSPQNYRENFQNIF